MEFGPIWTRKCYTVVLKMGSLCVAKMISYYHNMDFWNYKFGWCIKTFSYLCNFLLVLSFTCLFLSIGRHLLITFGGLAGLEESIEEDANLKVLHSSVSYLYMVVIVRLLPIRYSINLSESLGTYVPFSVVTFLFDMLIRIGKVYRS